MTKRSITPDVKRDYLEEHIPYMLKMLRYTYEQLNKPRHYLSWNAHFESFAVHARNLTNLLSNSDKGNVKADDFVRGGYKARKGDLAQLIKRLDEQVFHLAETRPRNVIGKFSTKNAKPVFEWIESHFADFLSYLSPKDQEMFDANKADPTKDDPQFITMGPTVPGAPAACTASPIFNHITHTTDSPQWTVVIERKHKTN
jgi:hypothetical protein